MMMRKLRSILVRLRDTVFRTGRDRDVTDELRAHVQLHIDDNMRAGMTREAARRDALIKLGGVDQIREQHRDRQIFAALDHVWVDLRHACRGLAKRPLLLATTTISIALGAGTNVAIHGAVYRVLFGPGLTALDPGHLVSVGPEASYPLFDDLRSRGIFLDLAARQNTTMTWRTESGTSSVTAGVVSANLFRVLGVPLLVGSGFDESNELGRGGPDRAVVSYEFWQRRLGADTAVVGRTLTLDGWPYTIAGVLPRNFLLPVGPLMSPPLFVPISAHVTTALDARNAPQLAMIGRLRAGATVAEARAALRVAAQQIEAAHPEDHRGLTRAVYVSSSNTLFSALNNSDEFAPQIRRIILSITGALYALAFLVLLIVCANVAGLLAARAVERAPEMAVRLALGATRGRLVQQLLAESFVVAAAGCAAGAALWIATATVLPTLPGIASSNITIVPGPLPLAYCLGLVVVVTLACGLIPAIAVNQTSPGAGLRSRNVVRRWSASRVLVAGQVAMCFTLLAGTFVLLFSLVRQNAADPGFDVEHTVVTRLRLPLAPQRAPNGGRTLFDWRDTIARVPGVTSVSFARYLPLGFLPSIWASAVRESSEAGDRTFAVDVHPVGPRYFETLGIRLEGGRDFVDVDIPSSYGGTAAIVNHTLAQQVFGGGDPIGRRLVLDQDPGRGRDRVLRVVGVARDTKLRSLAEGSHAVLYLPEVAPTLIVKVSGTAAGWLGPIDRVLADYDPTTAVTTRPLSDELARTLLPARAATMLLGALGGVGLLLAMVGLHGVVSYSVSRRTFEMGVRIALGATRATIMKIVFADAVTVVGAGAVVGGLLAFALLRGVWPLLTGGQSAMTPAAFAAVLALLAVVAVLASLRPARRAATTDPIVALRHD